MSNEAKKPPWLKVALCVINWFDPYPKSWVYSTKILPVDVLVSLII
jgi:hypothetical protein